MPYQDLMSKVNVACMKSAQQLMDICRVGTDDGADFKDGFEDAAITRCIELQSGKPQKKFYFTFGSDPGFPYQNTFMIVMADTEKDAVEKFRAKYPDRHKGIANCAFWYSEELWHRSRNEAEYGQPAEIIV